MSTSLKPNLNKVPASFPAFVESSCDNFYLFNRPASILTTAGHPERFFAPFSGALALSLTRQPLLLETPAGSVSAPVVAIAPLLRRRLYAPGGVVYLYIQPGSRWFGYFAALRERGFEVLADSPFSGLTEELQRLYSGHGQFADVMTLYHAGLGWLDCMGSGISEREECLGNELMALVDAKPGISLHALSRIMRCPYTGMSRLFRQSVGLSLREYRNWLKHRTVFSLMQTGMSLTQIAQCAGFTDSAHLSRIYRRTYGVPPSHSRKRKNVKFFLF